MVVLVDPSKYVDRSGLSVYYKNEPNIGLISLRSIIFQTLQLSSEF